MIGLMICKYLCELLCSFTQIFCELIEGIYIVCNNNNSNNNNKSCHCSRTVTASRVAGTGQHLIRPDSENMPESPDQVERPPDQPEQRKRKQCSHNLNKEVMYCYYKARRDQPRGYHKRMHQL